MNKLYYWLMVFIALALCTKAHIQAYNSRKLAKSSLEQARKSQEIANEWQMHYTNLYRIVVEHIEKAHK